MWRIFNGIPRAIRQHFHGPRAATGICVEDDKNDSYDSVENNEEGHGHHGNWCQYEKKQCDCGPQVNWQYADNEDKEWWKKQSCHNDFWSIFHGQRTAFEAVTWGAAVALGIQLSRPRWRDKYLCDGSEHRRNSFLYQVAFAMPGSGASTRLSITNECKDTSKTDGKQKDSSKPSSLDKVMKDFQSVCTEYTALGHSVSGLRHIETGNMSAAILNLTEASKLGHTSSQFNLGLCYEIGAGVEQDLDKAKEFYELAGESDHAYAIYNLALLETDEKKKIKLLSKAASLGLSGAQTYLGVYYIESDDIKDQKKAVGYFTSAAEQNDAEAQCFLGMCYERGLGGMQVNECKAADLYYKSAQTGHDAALYNLAVFHEYGLGGLPEDRVSAIELYEKAAEAGNENAELKLDEIQARADVEEWKALHVEKDEDRKTRTIIQTNGCLSPSVSSPSISEYVRKHLVQLTSTENPFSDEPTVVESNTKKDNSRKVQRARFSIGDEDWDEQDYLSERQNGLLKLSSISPTSNCSIMGMSRNSTMPELGYIRDRRKL